MNTFEQNIFMCHCPINPLLPSAANMRRSAKTLILIQEGINKKFPMSVATMSR